jgi:hypothetical protein
MSSLVDVQEVDCGLKEKRKMLLVNKADGQG